jgi:tetratricopeptide (TPR) repeat protein
VVLNRPADAKDPVVGSLMAKARSDGAVEEHRSLDRVHKALFGEETASIRVSRYLLQERIGGGSGGSVWVAHDPDLGRDVAIKLLRDPIGSRAGSREKMLREARALASLSHPNLVTVHDVGTYELGAEGSDEPATSGVFIVMELLDGMSLDVWLGRERPGWRRIAEVLLAAGRGLEAAHAEGLVHHDFKPSNVLVARDARVCVTDFGLARALPARADEGPEPGGGPVQGTPAFMAPEQHRGAVADARADQYAFCVALYVALYGRPPFVGESMEKLEEAKICDVPTTLPDVPRLPKAIRRAILRGLAADPRDRHPSMKDLLAEIEKALRARRRRWVLAAGLAAVLLPVSVVVVAGGQPSRCSDQSDTLVGIWDDEVRADVEVAFQRTGLPFAERTFALAAERLDAYAVRCMAARARACEAATTDDEAARRAAIWQGDCVDRRIRWLAAVSGLLREAGPALVQRASTVVEDMPSIASCERAPDSLPSLPTPGERRRLADLEAVLARAEVLWFSARYQEGIADLEPLLDESVDASVSARASILQARILARLGKVEEADHAATRGLALAERAGDVETAVQAMIGLIHILGYHQTRYAEADRLAAQAAARIEHAHLEATYTARLAHRCGNMENERGRYDRAAARFERVFEVCKDGCRARDSLERAALVGMGNARLGQGRHDEAERYYQEYLRRGREHLGEGHPIVAIAEHNLGELGLATGELADARHHLERALSIRDAVLGADHPENAGTLTLLARVAIAEGNSAEARKHLERAEAIAAGRSAHLLVMPSIRMAQAQVARGEGDHEHAIGLLEQVLDDHREHVGADHPGTLTAMRALAEALCSTGRATEGLSLARNALAAHERVFGPQNPRTVGTRTLMQRCAKRAGQRSTRDLWGE